MKIWGTLGWAGSSCAEVRPVRPQEFCFASHLNDGVDQYGLHRDIMCLRAIKEEI